ncbi:S-adenosylmethionine decarboxylase family protein [Sphingobium cupriresistens]|uniref:Adenosylmethionine decarboxylase n=1 Tax=Sphingobium cupriresistens TaxID=1132417 RepID=A0A8G1ZIZ5_9SPHN|nr:hypothetical protein EWH12_08245 [Sphingobium cupriresistens]
MPGPSTMSVRWRRVLTRLFSQTGLERALIAESHMSIHSWPKHGYAAIDIFLSGAPHDSAAALATLADHLAPERITWTMVRRG